MVWIEMGILVALCKVLIETENELLCAILFMVPLTLFNVLSGAGLLGIVASTTLGAGFAYTYFWLLGRFTGSGFMFILIMIVGLLGPFGLRMVLAW